MQVLEKRITEKGLTSPRLAAATGLSEPHIINIRAGRTRPSIGTLHRLAAALGCQYADLHDATVPAQSRLRARRVAAGVPASVLADRLAISPEHLYAVETGRRNLTAGMAEAAAAELGCAPSDLTDDSDVAA
jgi:transcriptional regulator with XRE-family HTH domain